MYKKSKGGFYIEFFIIIFKRQPKINANRLSQLFNYKEVNMKLSWLYDNYDDEYRNEEFEENEIDSSSDDNINLTNDSVKNEVNEINEEIYAKLDKIEEINAKLNKIEAINSKIEAINARLDKIEEIDFKIKTLNVKLDKVIDELSKQNNALPTKHYNCKRRTSNHPTEINDVEVVDGINKKNNSLSTKHYKCKRITSDNPVEFKDVEVVDEINHVETADEINDTEVTNDINHVETADESQPEEGHEEKLAIENYNPYINECFYEVIPKGDGDKNNISFNDAYKMDYKFSTRHAEAAFYTIMKPYSTIFCEEFQKCTGKVNFSIEKFRDILSGALDKHFGKKFYAARRCSRYNKFSDLRNPKDMLNLLKAYYYFVHDYSIDFEESSLLYLLGRTFIQKIVNNIAHKYVIDNITTEDISGTIMNRIFDKTTHYTGNY